MSFGSQSTHVILAFVYAQGPPGPEGEQGPVGEPGLKVRQTSPKLLKG